MINKLREMADLHIRISSKEELKKYELIKEILKEDDCFFKMDIEDAYSILRDLGFEDEDVKNIYSKLIEK